MTHHSIERYLQVNQAYGASFSADGQHLFFLSNMTGIPQVFRLPLADQILWPEQLTFGRERVQSAHPDPNNPNRLIFARDVGGNENAQLYLLELDTMTETLLTAGHEDAIHALNGWSADGSAFFVVSNRRDRVHFDLFTSADNGQMQQVYRNPQRGYLGGVNYAPDGLRAVMVHVPRSFDFNLLEVELASGEARNLGANQQGVRYGAPHYTPDGNALYFLTDYDRDFMYIARLSFDTMQIEPFITQDWDVESLIFSDDGRYMAYSVNTDGNDAIYVRDMTNGETRQAPLNPVPGIVGLGEGGAASFGPDGDKLLFTYLQENRTADVFLWDFASDSIRPLTQSSHAGLPTTSFVLPELIHYPTFDTGDDGQTRTIPAWLYKPQGVPGPYPVIVMVHGGPESQARPGFNALRQYFVNNGYAVFVPNVRGSTGYGKAYSHLDDVRKRMDSVADLAHAAHWLRDQPDINGDQIVVYGGSYGGFMVLAALTTYPDLWAAGIDIVGISSLVTFLENTSDYRREHRESEYGSLEHDRDFLESISPITHIDNVRAPLMVIHGRNDPRVPVTEAEQMVAELEARHVPVELLIFDDEGHGLVKLENRLVAYPRMIAFLQAHLG